MSTDDAIRKLLGKKKARAAGTGPGWKPYKHGVGEGQKYQFFTRKGHRLKVIRFRSGYLVAWRVPKGVKDPAFVGTPISTPRTRNLDELLDAAVDYLDRYLKKR